MEKEASAALAGVGKCYDCVFLFVIDNLGPKLFVV